MKGKRKRPAWLPLKMTEERAPKYASKKVLKENKHLLMTFE
jgi:hypothetical protein